MPDTDFLKRHVAAVSLDCRQPSWWEPLYEASANRSIFLSGPWLQSWLEVYGASVRGIWVRWEHDGATIGGCLLLSQLVWKKLVPMRTLFLNATAAAFERTPLAEFNDILHLPGFEEAIAADFARLLQGSAWIRLLIDGHENGGVAGLLARSYPRALLEQEVKPAPYVDLAGLRDEAFEATLTRNARGQIRRSLRLYERRYGAVAIHVAPSVAEALSYLEEMALLSNRRWRSKGVFGSLASPRMLDFHRKLIVGLWPRRAVDLIRIRAGDVTLGYLYNFTDRGKVYFFQSGLTYETDARLKPGLVSHALAIDHYRKTGFREYDFLASDARYKRSLAKQSRDLYWTKIYRDLPWVRGLLLARSLGRRTASLFGRLPSDVPTRRLRILVLGNDTRSFLATVRSLGRAGHEVLVAGDTHGGAAFASRYVSKLVWLRPFARDDDAWFSELQELLDRHSVDLVIPCSESLTIPLQAAQRRLRTRARLYVLPDELHRTTCSKIEMHRIAEELGIPVARSVVAADFGDAKAALTTLAGPWVFKPEFSYVDTDLATRNSVRKAYTLDQGMGLAGQFVGRGRFQIQENFVGVGTGVEVLCDRGEILLVFQHLRVHEPMHGGGSSYRRGISVHPGMLEAARKLMAHLQYTGVAMVEFKWDRGRDRWIFVEINARFWGSLPLAIASGADFPRALVDLMMFGRRPSAIDVRTDLHARNLALDVDWLISNVRADKEDSTLAALPWRSVFGELSNLLRGNEKWDTLAADDPAPFLHELAEILAEKLDALMRRISHSRIYLAATRARRRKRLRALLPGARSIGFVCHGNICRSPFAEAYARSRMRGVNFFSAGFHPAVGRPPPDTAISAAASLGIDLSAHSSRLLNLETTQSAEALFVFDARNLRDLHAKFPEAKGKTFLLSDLSLVSRGTIDDPWEKELPVFLATYRNIQDCIDSMAG